MKKKIKEIYDEEDSFPIVDETFDRWYKQLLNKREEELNELDIYRMFRQDLFRELAVRKSIEIISEAPTAGYMWDGQFLELLAAEPVEALQFHADDLKRLLQSLDLFTSANENWDVDFDKTEFLEKCAMLKKKVDELN